MSRLDSALKSIALVKQAAVNKLARSFDEFEKRALSVKDTELETVKNLISECGHFWGQENIFSSAEETEGSDTVVDVFADNEDSVRNRRAIIRNCQRLLERAEREPKPDYLFGKIRAQLLEEIGRERIQLSHAKFISDLVFDWSVKGDVPPTEAARSERKDQLDTWISIVSAPSAVDTSAIKLYLENLFTLTAATEKGFEYIKAGLKRFSKSLRSDITFDVNSLQYSIKSILAGDLAEPEQQAFLREFGDDEVMLQEMVHVLNLRAKNLSSWDFDMPDGFLMASQRRKLNGKYRVYVHYDVIDLILWFVIGASWGAQFKYLAKRFLSEAWFRPNSHISREESYRRFWFLDERISVGESQGGLASGESINSDINAWYANNVFMQQLPNDRLAVLAGYGDEINDEADNRNPKSPANLRRHLLNIIAAESLIAKHAGTDHAVLCSDFEWFGPSTSHQVIYEVLSFFGVDEFWISMFKKFLSVPFKFEGGQIIKRERGVPISFPISDFFTEAVLFVLDFAINSTTHENILRLHDDLWLRGTPEDVESAWKKLNEFASVFGYTLNKEKTGCVTTSPRPDLPTGSVRHGFLTLNDELLFDVDHTLIEKHAVEMRRQLDASPSLLSFVKSLQSYTRFVLFNLNTASWALGVRHVDNSIGAVQLLMEKAFGEDVIDFMKKKYNCGPSDNPMGVWYWPMKLGGIGLWDPLAELYGQREYAITKNRVSFKDTDLSMLETYERKKDSFDKKGCTGNAKWIPQDERDKLSKEQFMSKESYFKTRLYTSHEYLYLFNVLTSPLNTATPEVTTNLPVLDCNDPDSIKENFKQNSSYWKYIISLYGKELSERFGSLQLTKDTLVPLALADLERSKKQHWTA